MVADSNIKSYYLQFKSNAKNIEKEYRDKLEEISSIKKELVEYLQNNKDTLYEQYSIKLDNYEEWVNNSYSTSEKLYKDCIKLLKEDVNVNGRINLIQLSKYTNALRNEYRYNIMINNISKRAKLTFGEYRNYVTKYFNTVHKFLLEGNGYKFTHGIGIYIINYWTIPNETKKNIKKLDFAATNKRKKEIIESGRKPYDEKEAIWYKMRNIPYDGVDYKVYKNDSHYYEFTIIHSKLFTNRSIDYDRTEYINAKYRGLSYDKIAEYCNSLDDIANLQVDIKVKLNILLYKDPAKYLNFIRNAEREKYTIRKTDC